MENQAITRFRSGFNCAQSVLTTFTERYQIDLNTAAILSCGFGAGMGRLQQTCGAVTGAYMAIGAHVCSRVTDNKERKEQTYALIREFNNRFMSIHGTTQCFDLLKTDLKTPEGQKTFHDDHLNELVCEKCISNAVSIAEDLFKR